MTISNYSLKTPDGIDATSVASTVNSSTAALGSSATFTGTWEDVAGYNSTTVALLCDSDCTLKIQFSLDGTNIDSSVPFTVVSGSGEFHRLTNVRRYMRVVVENGTSAQTYLRLQTLKGQKELLTSALNSTLQSDSDAIVSRTITEESMIAEGKYSGRFIVNKFGRNPDIDTGSVPEDVWAFGGLYTGFPTGSAETLDVSSSSASDTSAGVGARTMRIFGLDSNYDLQQEDITLNGTFNVTTANTYLRVYRAYILTAGSSETNVGNIQINHTTTTANVFGYVVAGKGQTELSNYTIPNGYTGYLKDYVVSCLDTSSNDASVAIWYRELNGAVRLIRPVSVSTDTDSVRNIYGGISIPEKTDFMFRVVSVVNNNAEVTVDYNLLVVKN